MKYVALKEHIASQGVQPIYLLEGEEGYFRAGGSEMIFQALRPDKTLDYSSFDGSVLKGEKIKELVSALLAFPFLSEKRLVRVSEFYPTEKEFDAYLKGVFENPPKTSTLLIVNSGKGKKEHAVLSKKQNVTIVECKKAEKEMICKWIVVTAKRAGIYVDGVTAGRICAYCNLDMSRVSKEVEKLISYLAHKGEKRITDDLVEEMVSPDIEYSVFQLSDALSAKNYNGFLKIAKELMQKGSDEISLLTTLAFHFRDVYDVSLAKGTEKEVALALNMHEFVVKKSRALAQKIGRDRARQCYEWAFEGISGIKSGIYMPATAWKLVVGRLFFDPSYKKDGKEVGIC